MSSVSSSDPYIPPGATCYVIDYSSSHTDVAVCLPGEGLLVLRDRQVVGWCDVEDGVKNIAIFFTYQPWCKHYVLQLPSKVKVVSGLESLKITHTYEDVRKFEIRDFKNQGFPQIGLWKEDSKTLCVTDLTASALPLSNPVDSVLSSKVRGLKLSVDKVIKQLEIKKRLRRHCTTNVLRTGIPESSNKLNTLVPFVGTSSFSQKKGSKSLEHSLVRLASWQRLLSKKWVLGCDVQNNGLGALRRPSRRAGGVHGADGGASGRPAPHRPATATHFLSSAAAALGQQQQQGDASPWVVVPADGVLEPGQRASIVATVPEPAFCGRSPFVEVRGEVSAALPDGQEVRVSVPGWRLSVDAVLSGALLPFRDAAAAAAASEDPADVLACLACCPVGVRLRLEGRRGLSDRVAALLSEANLRVPGAPAGAAAAALGPTGALLVGAGPSEAPLHGALAVLRVLATDTCTLRLHTRDAAHVLLLAHRLLDGLPQHTRLRAASATLTDDEDRGPGTLEQLTRGLVRALGDELRALAGADGRLPARAALHPLEVATDLAAQRLRLRLAQTAPSVD
ncbi:hypothetical protein ONE63_005454 [Megalurothrips usitatus]|uniref:Fanconi anemia core complex-associated protein 100 n=1 Tax=Megalurothrips usitatus TaxID=439358 RepID=A0AAV7Y2E6_9NEOP|nr:hypothetical protein ONE63_005454 [Megalurothrips usitatus]